MRLVWQSAVLPPAAQSILECNDFIRPITSSELYCTGTTAAVCAGCYCTVLCCPVSGCGAPLVVRYRSSRTYCYWSLTKGSMAHRRRALSFCFCVGQSDCMFQLKFGNLIPSLPGLGSGLKTSPSERESTDLKFFVSVSRRARMLLCLEMGSSCSRAWIAFWSL
jgi:hypothetical protein